MVLAAGCLDQAVAASDVVQLGLHQAPQVVDDLAGRLELVGHDAVHTRLEEGEEREPDAGADDVALHKRLVVGQRMVVEEQAAGDVERNEHVYRVVFVCGQNKEDTKHVHDPRDRVKKVQVPWSI